MRRLFRAGGGLRDRGEAARNKGLSITDRLETGDTAAVFGKFTYESNTLGKTITSPFCILIRVSAGKIVYMQFMEDTFGTASTFKQGGAWTMQAIRRARLSRSDEARRWLQ